MRTLEPVVKRVRGKVRAGRGFSLDELKEAGLTLDYARRRKIPIDYRRSSKWPENVAKLKGLLPIQQPVVKRRIKKKAGKMED